MMEEWIAKRSDFEYVLCLDLSRWGRFQDIDLPAQFSAICTKHHKQVIYSTIGKSKENDPLYPVYVQFERFPGAQYSQPAERQGLAWVRQDRRTRIPGGGPPPYGLSRLLLDEKREPLHVLEAGQHKGLQSQRVTLTEGPPEQMAVIRRIFDEFVEEGTQSTRSPRDSMTTAFQRPQQIQFAATVVSQSRRLTSSSRASQ